MLSISLRVGRLHPQVTAAENTRQTADTPVGNARAACAAFPSASTRHSAIVPLGQLDLLPLPLPILPVVLLSPSQNMFPQAWPPSLAERMKAVIVSIFYATMGLSADALFATLRIIRVIAVDRPATDNRVRCEINVYATLDR